MSGIRTDVAIIGGGMAGASLAYELAPHARTLLIEREEQSGYHATGRSAALFEITLGNPHINRATLGSRDFLLTPPDGFASAPVVSDIGGLFLALAGDIAALKDFYSRTKSMIPDAERLTPEETAEHYPILRPEEICGAVFDPETRRIDVDVLLQGYLRGFKARGGETLYSGEVRELRRDGGAWRIETAAGVVIADAVVNAAGAWADDLAQKAGVPPVGLTPMRRTAVLVEPPDGHDIAAWPFLGVIDNAFYFKPESGFMLLCPGDETPCAPSDVQAEEIDVAEAIERYHQMCRVQVRRVHAKWAGLRTFAPDRTQVLGFDPAADGFFWLAGQGGYGIQTAPYIARLARDLLLVRPPEGDPKPFLVNRFR